MRGSLSISRRVISPRLMGMSQLRTHGKKSRTRQRKPVKWAIGANRDFTDLRPRGKASPVGFLKTTTGKGEKYCPDKNSLRFLVHSHLLCLEKTEEGTQNKQVIHKENGGTQKKEGIRDGSAESTADGHKLKTIRKTDKSTKGPK